MVSLVSLLTLAESCATKTSSIAVYPASAPASDVFPLLYEAKGKKPEIVICMQEQSFGDLLAGIEIQKGECNSKLAKSEIARKIAEKQAEEAIKGSSSLQWKAIWGPVIGFVAGALTAGAVAAGVAALVR